MTPHEVAQKACNDWFAYQSDFELEMALTALQRANTDGHIKVIMEIGTAHGASLAAWAEIVKPELCIALDPEEMGGNKGNEKEQASFDQLAEKYKFLRIPHYDRSPDAHTKLKAILGDRKIDFLFIDAAHGYNDASYDFYGYMEYLAPGAIIGFHDIYYSEGLVGAGSQVCWLWDEVKRRYNYNEFYYGSSMGIGFIYRGQPAPPSPHKL